MVKRIQGFFQETAVEWKKVTWPTAEELRGSTIVVLVTMLALAFFIGALDLVMSQLINVMLR